MKLYTLFFPLGTCFCLGLEYRMKFINLPLCLRSPQRMKQLRYTTQLKQYFRTLEFAGTYRSCKVAIINSFIHFFAALYSPFFRNIDKRIDKI